VAIRNYYLTEFFAEGRLTRMGLAATLALLAALVMVVNP
jgi:hypothetical protein